jgi:hypothetical protein
VAELLAEAETAPDRCPEDGLCPEKGRAGDPARQRASREFAPLSFGGSQTGRQQSDEPTKKTTERMTSSFPTTTWW